MWECTSEPRLLVPSDAEVYSQSSSSLPRGVSDIGIQESDHEMPILAVDAP